MERHGRTRGGNMNSAELAAACDAVNAGRLSEQAYDRMLERAFAGRSARELARIHSAIAECQGRTVMAFVAARRSSRSNGS